ncbi:hypothetical protein BJ944DRAFT_15821 [Cunninghamella echinulata]|nr:hypothetical protein BJ944DRAFT_15821 [Cunninghamella echinulata]
MNGRSGNFNIKKKTFFGLLFFVALPFTLIIFFITMAKGLRSHTKKKTRSIKRSTVFKPVEDSRLQRLAIAQAEAAKKPSVGDHMKEDNSNIDDAMMDTTDKISTGGFRSNKQKKAFKLKKGKKKTTNKW